MRRGRSTFAYSLSVFIGLDHIFIAETSHQRPLLQVVVCAACEQTITGPCDAMFPNHNMHKVVPYASSNAMDSPLSADIVSGHGQSSPASRKQPAQQPNTSSIRLGDSPTREVFSPIASRGGHAWGERSAALSGWASPPCWSPRAWGGSKGGTCGPSAGVGSLAAEAARQHHSSQENHNVSHIHHLKNNSHRHHNAQGHHHYPVAPPPPRQKSGNGKLRTKSATMPHPSSQARQRDRKSARRCNALRRMLCDVLPVGFMPCAPLIKDLPADLFGALCPRGGSSHDSTTTLQHHSQGNMGAG